MSRELSSNPRYTAVPSTPNDEFFPERTDLPPSYNDVTSNPVSAQNGDAAQDGNTEPKWNNYVPPSYEASTTLPSYKDVEQDKLNAARFHLATEMFNLADDSNEPQLNGIDIGSDCLFIFAFLVAFLFNWLGLFIGYFIMFNLAGRYGSMSGFGMSMIKWLTYIKYSDCCNNYLINQHEYIWWIVVFFSFVLMMKGTVNWMTVRRYRYSTNDTEEENAQFIVVE